MALYAFGANYHERGDVSDAFINGNVVGIGWDAEDAPDLHQFITSLKVGDIVYIKSYPIQDRSFDVLAIGVIRDSEIISNVLIEIGRNVSWKQIQKFRIAKPDEKNNVRLNSVYQEFHPQVQAEIINRLWI